MALDRVRTIQFDDNVRSPTDASAGGVYPLRARSNTGVGSIRSPSLKRSRTSNSDQEALQSPIDTEPDVDTKQTFTGWKLFWLAYQSTGVIYGDIGTSPLYVYSSTFTSNPTQRDLLGVLSLIIWTLTLMVSIKYVLIVLRADDEGEGGTFAIFSLLSRYANIMRRDPHETRTVKMLRARTAELGIGAKKTRSFMENSRAMQWLLRSVGVFGVSLVMSDGVLTPAQSVLGAIQGLEVVAPRIDSATVVGVSCGVLILLFAIQPFGTTRLATAFAPVVILWLLLNLVFGIYNLVIYDASVLKAFSPFYAGDYLVRNGTTGWKSLGGVMLAFTGCEALFADLGAFTRRAVQLSWLGFAFPCLLLSYIGQAAYLAHKPEAWSNPFYNSVPPGMLYPSLVIAILAAMVASQAMITAVFQLISQITTLSYFPQIKVVHTSKIFYGQIYVPAANWVLMVGTIIVTVAYNNTTRLGHAYGVCVILVTFITTNMVGLVALIVWRLPSYIVFPLWLVFAAFDALYLSSALTKVPEGAWLTLALALILSSFFMLWHFGKEQQWRAEATDRFPLHHLLTSEKPDTTNTSPRLQLTPSFGGHPVTTIGGMAIFFDKSGHSQTTPTVFIHFLQKLRAAPSVIVFFHLRPLQIPSVPAEDRFKVSRCRISDSSKANRDLNVFRVTIKHGYTDHVVSDDLGVLVYQHIRDFIIREAVPDLQLTSRIAMKEVSCISLAAAEEGDHSSHPHSDRDTPASSNPSAVAAAAAATATEKHSPPGLLQTQSQTLTRLLALQTAFESQVVYVLGQEKLRIRSDTKIWRRVVLGVFLFVQENTRRKVQALKVDTQKVVEVGFVKDF